MQNSDFFCGRNKFFFGSRHCAAVLFSRVSKKSIVLELSFLYILMLGTYSKFAWDFFSSARCLRSAVLLELSHLYQSPPWPILREEEVPVTSLTYSKIETRMDRPKSVVRVIRGVVYTVHVSHLFVGKFWHVRNPLPQSIGLRFSVLVHC